MFENIKGKGWFEPEKNQEGKSPKHQEVSTKEGYKSTSREPIEVQEKEEKDEKEEKYIIECPKKHMFSVTISELKEAKKTDTIQCSECKKSYRLNEWRGIED